jgi:parallel beta-helix repeat protein
MEKTIHRFLLLKGNIKIFIITALSCCLCGCLLEVTSITVPNMAQTGDVITITVNGVGSNCAEGGSPNGIILQIPQGTQVVSAYYSNSYQSGYLTPDDSITRGYIPESGYKLYGGTATYSGTCGSSQGITLQVQLSIPNNVKQEIYKIKAAVGGYKNGIWTPQKPVNGTTPITTFAEISGNYVSNAMTIFAGSGTTISSNIIYDTTWTKAGSPYFVTQSVDIYPDVTLTIEPGVVILFSKGTNLDVYGALVARGTVDEMITFTSNQITPAKGDWGGIIFKPGAIGSTWDAYGNYVSGSIIDYCEISYGMGLQNANPIQLIISNNTISNNSTSGIINHGNSGIWFNKLINNSGAGIYNAATSTIYNNTLTNNSFSSYYFGGIYNTGSSSISFNKVSYNSFDSSYRNTSGGIYSTGVNATIHNNTVTNNTFASSYAGGIYSAGSSTISNNTVTGNSFANYSASGGIYSADVNATIHNNTVTNNTFASSYAGGIYNTGSSTISNNTVTGNSFTYNSASGGIYNTGSSTISNNTVAGNSLPSYYASGGIYSSMSSSTINNNTIENNHGKGIYCNSCYIINNKIRNNSGMGIYGGPTITNNIIKDNTAQNGSIIYAGTTFTITNNIIKGNTAQNGSVISAYGLSLIEGNDIICNSTKYGISSGGPLSGFSGNNLCNYSDYEFYYTATTDQQAANNYWCTTVDIGNLIYDYWDNITLGKVLYQPFAETPFNISGEPVICCVKFNDVPTGFWAEDYIEAIACHNITTGCGGGNYCPGNPVTRGQMATFIVRAIEGEPPDNYCDTGLPFADVPRTHIFCKYIKRVYELGITIGCGNGNYCPFNPVTRAQMAVFIIRAKFGENFTYGTMPHFADIPESHWAFKYIQKLYEENITTGYADGTYRPSQNVNRAQMAAFIAKAFLGMEQ